MVLSALSFRKCTEVLVYFLIMTKVKLIHQVKFYTLVVLFLIVVLGWILNSIQKIKFMCVLIVVVNCQLQLCLWHWIVIILKKHEKKLQNQNLIWLLMMCSAFRVKRCCIHFMSALHIQNLRKCGTLLMFLIAGKALSFCMI